MIPLLTLLLVVVVVQGAYEMIEFWELMFAVAVDDVLPWLIGGLSKVKEALVCKRLTVIVVFS
jgi:hypothetical protein